MCIVHLASLFFHVQLLADITEVNPICCFTPSHQAQWWWLQWNAVMSKFILGSHEWQRQPNTFIVLLWIVIHFHSCIGAVCMVEPHWELMAVGDSVGRRSPSNQRVRGPITTFFSLYMEVSFGKILNSKLLLLTADVMFVWVNSWMWQVSQIWSCKSRNAICKCKSISQMGAVLIIIMSGFFTSIASSSHLMSAKSPNKPNTDTCIVNVCCVNQ